MRLPSAAPTVAPPRGAAPTERPSAERAGVAPSVATVGTAAPSVEIAAAPNAAIAAPGAGVAAPCAEIVALPNVERTAAPSVAERIVAPIVAEQTVAPNAAEQTVAPTAAERIVAQLNVAQTVGPPAELIAALPSAGQTAGHTVMLELESFAATLAVVALQHSEGHYSSVAVQVDQLSIVLESAQPQSDLLP